MTYVAQLNVPTDAAARYVDALCEDLASLEIETTREAAGAVLTFPRGFGTARIEADPGSLRVHAEAETERGISALKFIIAVRLEAVASEENPELVWVGYGDDFKVLPGLREITVTAARNITPHMRRITFTGNDMARYQGDETHVRLLFPPEGLERPEWPTPGRNGRPVWPPLERRPAARVYTIRGFDVARGEIDIDFVLHGDHGVAGKWAASAEPGDMIGILGPGGAAPDPARWYLLAGDETAIPDIARRLESLPDDAEGVVLIEVADAGERQELAVPSGFSLTWLCRDGLEPGRNTLLLDAVRAVTLPREHRDECLFWLGAEATTARAVRSFWQDEIGLPRQVVHAFSYWRHELSGGE